MFGRYSRKFCHFVPWQSEIHSLDEVQEQNTTNKWASECQGTKSDRNFCDTRKNCIFFPKLFWPTVRKNCSSDREKPLKFEAKGWEFAKILRSLEQFIQTVKGQNNFW